MVCCVVSEEKKGGGGCLFNILGVFFFFFGLCFYYGMGDFLYMVFLVGGGEGVYGFVLYGLGLWYLMFLFFFVFGFCVIKYRI